MTMPLVMQLHDGNEENIQTNLDEFMVVVIDHCLVPGDWARKESILIRLEAKIKISTERKSEFIRGLVNHVVDFIHKARQLLKDCCSADFMKEVPVSHAPPTVIVTADFDKQKRPKLEVIEAVELVYFCKSTLFNSWSIADITAWVNANFGTNLTTRQVYQNFNTIRIRIGGKSKKERATFIRKLVDLFEIYLENCDAQDNRKKK